MTTVTDNTHLAAAVRRVNAEWSQAGEPGVGALRVLWLDLQRRLHLADLEGDHGEATRAIRAWQAAAIAAIWEAAEEVAS